MFIRISFARPVSSIWRWSAGALVILAAVQIPAVRGAQQPDPVDVPGTAEANAAPMQFPTGLTRKPILGPEKGVCRRDPSDVICVDGTYYVWYTKILADQPGFPSGYPGSVWYASSSDGHDWTERGAAVKPTEGDAFDSHGVFTPNILVADGKYYLYYTAVGHPFPEPKTGNNMAKTAIGVAIADSPEGPWTRSDENPVLLPEDDPEYFDSHRCDDACLVVREGKYWLYYKGRQWKRSPGQTKMGVAIGPTPEGPFAKWKDNPVVDSGHEVMTWPYRGGVAAMINGVGPQRFTWQFAPDGVDFRAVGRVYKALSAPGSYREDHFRNDRASMKIRWGVDHGRAPGHRGLHLDRYDFEYGEPPTAELPDTSQKPVGPLHWDFESGDLQGWEVVEGRFAQPVSDLEWFRNLEVRGLRYNKQGKYHLSTVETAGPRPDDEQTGRIRSPKFVLQKPAVSFLIGGGSAPETYIALCTADGRRLLEARGKRSEVMRRVVWRPEEALGQPLYLEVVDAEKGPWGHVTLDDVSAAGELFSDDTD